jgi:hypothetical protein
LAWLVATNIVPLLWFRNDFRLFACHTGPSLDGAARLRKNRRWLNLAEKVHQIRNRPVIDLLHRLNNPVSKSLVCKTLA